MTRNLNNQAIPRTRPLVLAGALLALASAHGAPVAIVNHSFETDDVSGLTSQLNTDIVPTGWTAYDDGRNNAVSGNNRGLVYHGPGTSAVGPTLGQNDGSQSFFTAQRDILQVLGATLEANTTYTLTVAIGDRNVANAGGDVGDNRIHLGYGASGGSNILATLDSTSPGAVPTVNGDWVEWTMSYTTGASPAGLGELLRIELTTDTNVGWFDNVRLTAAKGSPAPSFALDIDAVGSDLVFSWPSQSGKVYDLLASADLENAPDTWAPVPGQEEIPATPDTNTLTIARPAEDRMFFAVRERDPSPGGGPITVILLAGQSNMLGSGTVVADLPVALQSPQEDVQFTYGGTAGSISGLTGLQPGSGLQYGPEITFGRTVADAYPAGQFAVIKYADSSTDLENNWDPAGGSSHSAFVAKVAQGMNALAAAGYTPTISAMLWTQGERDARQGYEATYEANLNAFIADIRTRYGADLPFFISQLSSGQTDLPAAGLAGVRTAQANVAAADANAHLIVTDSFALRTDNLHFSGTGQVSLGQAFGASYLAEVGP